MLLECILQRVFSLDLVLLLFIYLALSVFN